MINKLLSENIPTPAYVVSESLLKKNLEILSSLQQETGVKILLAQKCFSMFYFYPLIEKYLSGTAASGLFEARLAHEHFRGDNHVFSPAYKSDEINEIASICEHVIFNSFRQVEKFASIVKSHNHQVGLRINPEHSTQSHAIYDPCSPTSRLGVRFAEFKEIADNCTCILFVSKIPTHSTRRLMYLLIILVNGCLNLSGSILAAGTS